MPTDQQLPYRSDVDGLRAVAVLAVVLFHFFSEFVPGGFVGVDVFFVISGYLISSVIFKDLKENRFSFAAFYSRRIRRIFPALTLVLAAIFGIGWYYLLANEYQQLGLHISASAGFIENFVLWDETGYFDNAAETKPLLHIWSLGVEEQFYLLWPFFLFSCHKAGKSLLKGTIVIAAASFLLNILTVRHWTAAAYFLPHTRFWELMVGAILAHQSTAIDSALKRPAYRHIASSLGLALVIGGFFIVTKRDYFPGWWALMPVFGAGLLIIAGQGGWVNRYVLSSRVCVGLGLISYPLYLWHWPFFSYENIIRSGKNLPIDARILWIGVSVVLAWGTYRFVEKPIRSRPASRKQCLTLILAMLLVAAFGMAGYLNGGFESRPIAYETKTLNDFYDSYFNGKTEVQSWGDKSCFLLVQEYTAFAENGCDRIRFPGRPTVLLVGDSHSAYLGKALRPYLEEKKYNFLQFSASFCTPLSMADNRERCRNINRKSLATIEDVKPDVLIIFAQYHLFSTDVGYGEPMPYENFLLRKAREFSAMGIKRILILGQYPIWGGRLPNLLARDFYANDRTVPERTTTGLMPEALSLDTKMKNFSWPKNVSYLSLKDLLCNEQGCLTRVGPNAIGDLITFDDGHLTMPGATYVTNKLLVTYFP